MLNLAQAKPYAIFLMKYSFWTLCAAVLLSGCNQSAPVTSTPTATAPIAAPTDTATEAVSSSTAATVAKPADKKAAPRATPALPVDEILQASFSFKSVPNPSDATHPKTNARLLIQGSKPMDIDLGNFASRPDVVNEAKAKLAAFPNGMIMGFRSYQASSGISSDLAVLHVNGRHLRIVQRRVDETAAEPGTFETAREIPMPINTKVVAAVAAKK
jgi:hypothetical protein